MSILRFSQRATDSLQRIVIERINRDQTDRNGTDRGLSSFMCVTVGWLVENRKKVLRLSE